MAETSASFRVMGKDLRPSEISALLGLTPDHSHELGSPRIGKSGRRYSDFSEGLWELRSKKVASDSITDHLSMLLAILRSREAAIRNLQSLGHTMDIFVGVFDDTGNLTLKIENQLLKSISDLGIDLVIDIYAK